MQRALSDAALDVAAWMGRGPKPPPRCSGGRRPEGAHSCMAMTSTQRALAVAGAIVLAFLLGFGWQAMRANRIETELERVERQLALVSLEATLGAAAIEAERGSHETSRQLASEFFTGLQQSIDRAPQSAQAELRSILAERDPTITMLSRADPEARHQLGRMFLRYRLALGRGPRTAPAPAPGPAAAPDPVTPPPDTTGVSRPR